MAAEPSGLRTRPGSLDELARTTGKAKSNLSRTLRTMEDAGLVRLERGERRRIPNSVCRFAGTSGFVLLKFRQL